MKPRIKTPTVVRGVKPVFTTTTTVAPASTIMRPPETVNGHDVLADARPTTNATFLAAIFAGLEADERPMVLRVDGKIDKDTRWPVGAPWTADLDTHSDGANWFFTLSSYKPKEDGTYRRQKAQFARAFGIFADDVGTKVPLERLAACPPSYLVETSPGNHHAGYLFDAPCADLKQVEALQDALVTAGLCDPGARGPSSRVGRLPRAVNTKYDPPAQCRLVEWHPTRRYSIEQIIERLELEPPARATRGSGGGTGDAGDGVYVPRPAQNAVIVALKEAGFYKVALGDGKHDITCPWVAEHTDQVDHGTTYFEPSSLFPLGGFKCQHGHCAEHRIKALLDALGVSNADARNKPVINAAPGEMFAVVSAMERELAGCGCYFQAGGLIVHVQRDPASGDSYVQPANVQALTRAMSALVRFERWDARARGNVPIDPPPRHVAVLFGTDHFAHLPPLRGLARQPYLRADDTLMMQDGYDAAGAMFGVFDATTYSVPAEPTKAEAEQAVAELGGLLEEFAFAEDTDAYAALALLITAAVRVALAQAPMFLISATAAGTGKTYLGALASTFAGPAEAHASPFPKSDEEMAKVILAKLLTSPAVVFFDNLTGDVLTYEALTAALTSQVYAGRVLGYSKEARVGTRSLFLATGNNVVARGDMSRRVLTIKLDAKVEEPAARRFQHQPLAEVLRHRERWVSRALTIVRAYIVAGCPGQDLPPLANFDDWTRLVRSPLVWLGLPDPAHRLYEGLREDPDRELLGRLLVAWREKYGSRAVAVKLVVDFVTSSLGCESDLAAVIHEVAGDRDVINRGRLGWWLRKRAGQIVGGLKVIQADKSRTATWKVVS